MMAVDCAIGHISPIGPIPLQAIIFPRLSLFTLHSAPITHHFFSSPRLRGSA